MNARSLSSRDDGEKLGALSPPRLHVGVTSLVPALRGADETPVGGAPAGPPSPRADVPHTCVSYIQSHFNKSDREAERGGGAHPWPGGEPWEGKCLQGAQRASSTEDAGASQLGADGWVGEHQEEPRQTEGTARAKAQRRRKETPVPHPLGTLSCAMPREALGRRGGPIFPSGPAAAPAPPPPLGGSTTWFPREPARGQTAALTCNDDFIPVLQERPGLPVPQVDGLRAPP